MEDGKAQGGQGLTYEARICMLGFVRGYIYKLRGFQLRYQVDEASKFDDAVFLDEQGNYVLIQLKHKNIGPTNQNIQANQSTQPKKITNSYLFNKKFNTDYNLIKYVKAFINANSTQTFRDKIDAAIVFTNISFDLNSNDELSLTTFQTPEEKSWYDGETKIKLEQIELDTIPIFDISGGIGYKFTADPKIVEILQRQAVTHAKDVGTINENQIKDALKKIIFAVKQPNVQELEQIIKTEIKDHFKLDDKRADIIYCILDNRFTNWCNTKNPFDQSSTIVQQHILTFGDADKIFQEHVKVISFGVTAPTAAFTGRVQQLEEIRQQLDKGSSLIVSQSLKISGLGGIGKTQLAKKFIQEFGQREFYGRVIWIESQRDETVRNSFEGLAQVLKIQDVRNKDIKVLIDEVFQYFAGLKVLIVFDNFDKSPDYENSLVVHCCETVSKTSPESGRPYFLFTSRNRGCLPGVPVLELELLSAEEAKQLILNELKEVNLSAGDAEKLAKVHQYFPLALRQAIAYIKQQQQIEQLFEQRYDVQNYYVKFNEETTSLLDFEFPNDFGITEKTVFITWNVTLDAIRSDQENGANAIQLLQTLAYLYPDKISPNLFLTLFDNDKGKTARALLLLEKYSMITKIERSSLFQIHRLVQAVIQIKYKNESAEIMGRAFKIINPKLCEKNDYFYKLRQVQDFRERNDILDAEDELKNLMEECPADQIMHYNQLSVHILKHEQLKTKFLYLAFFDTLNDAIINEAMKNDNVEKLKALVNTDDLKKFFEKKIDKLILFYSNTIIKYVMESGQLEESDQVTTTRDNSMIKWTVSFKNVEFFKYLFERGSDLSGVLESASPDLISEITTGKSDLLQDIIKNKSDSNQKVLNECLFFATIFNQDSIVRDLLPTVLESNFTYKKWSLIYVAAIFGFKNLLEILLSFYDPEHLRECLSNLLMHPRFTNKETFEIICEAYIKKGDLNEMWQKFCFSFTIDKLDVGHFLLDKGADPRLCSDDIQRGLRKIFKSCKVDRLSVYDKCRFDKFLDRIIFQDLTPDKFINVSYCIFCVQNWLIIEYYRNLFEKIVKEVEGVNIKNAKGETLLVKYLKYATDSMEPPKIETVEYLVEHGVDVESQDNESKPALLYAKEYFQIYCYLLTKVQSVDENALENAIKFNNKELVQKLFETHFTVDHRFKNGKTVIEVAVESVSPKIVLLCKDEFKKYQEHGDVNKRNEDVTTLLHRHIYDTGNNIGYGLIVDRSVFNDDVKFLIDNGLDINNPNHVSVYSSAAFFHMHSICSYILKKSKEFMKKNPEANLNYCTCVCLHLDNDQENDDV